MKKTFFVLLLLAAISYSSFSQDINRRADRKIGAGITILGPVFMGSIQGDYFITPNFNVEAGVGQIAAYVGGKYYFGSPERDKPWAPYIGFTYRIPGLLSDDESGFYTPIGIQYMAKSGFTLASEWGFINSSTHKGPYWGALRISYHF